MTEDKPGCVIVDGVAIPFDEWYLRRFDEEPTRENIRRRIAKLKAEKGILENEQ